MSPGQKQQQRKAELRQRFIAGPPPHKLRALLSSAERRREELSAELMVSRHENENLRRRLDEAQERLARARDALAELDPGRYWKERGL